MKLLYKILKLSAFYYNVIVINPLPITTKYIFLDNLPKVWNVSVSVLMELYFIKLSLFLLYKQNVICNE